MSEDESAALCPERDGKNEVSDNRPPGKGYVLFVLIVLAAAVGTAAGVMIEWDGGSTLRAIIVVLFVVPLVLIAVLPLQAAFSTEYSLNDGRLRARAGIAIRADLKCADMEQVLRVPFIPRVLGWGGGRGLANRFTDGVQIVMRSGAVYYFSPSDPTAFVQALSITKGSGTRFRGNPVGC